MNLYLICYGWNNMTQQLIGNKAKYFINIIVLNIRLKKSS